MLALKILQVPESKAVRLKNLRWVMCQTSLNITELPYLKNNYKHIPLLPPRKKNTIPKNKGRTRTQISESFLADWIASLYEAFTFSAACIDFSLTNSIKREKGIRTLHLNRSICTCLVEHVSKSLYYANSC